MISYNKLKDFERTLNNLLDEYFTNQPSMFNPGYICKQISQYSSHIHPIDKYTKDAMDACERFKRVRHTILLDHPLIDIHSRIHKSIEQLHPK